MKAKSIMEIIQKQKDFFQTGNKKKDERSFFSQILEFKKIENCPLFFLGL